MASSDTRTPANGNARDGAPMIAAALVGPRGRNPARNRRIFGLRSGGGHRDILTLGVVVLATFVVIARRNLSTEAPYAFPRDERAQGRDGDQRDEAAEPIDARETVSELHVVTGRNDDHQVWRGAIRAARAVG